MTDRLSIDADLRLDVDGVRAQVTGHGQHVTVTTGQPAALLRAAVRRAEGAPGLSQVTDLLADQGLTITVAGSRGPLATVGAEVRSSPWRFVRVRPGRLPVVAVGLAGFVVGAAVLARNVARRR